MNIDKAIEILNLHFKGHSTKRDPDFFNALYLGIEALKVLHHGREIGAHIDPVDLPGETKD